MKKTSKRIKKKNNMIYDVNSINVQYIRQEKSLFENEKEKFNSYTYKTFLSSYLNNSDNEYIRIMTNKLYELYKNIEKDYDSIFNWWDNYIKNISSLEKCLSDDYGTFGLTETTIRNFVNYNLRNKL